MTVKNVTPKKVNPDQIPATMGYVKCIARKTYYHKHRVDIDSWWTFLTAIVAWMIVIGVNIISLPSSATVIRIPEPSYWAVVSIAIVSSVAALDLHGNNRKKTTSPKQLDIIEKYQEPNEEDDC
jgi:hypothetical protein